MYLENLKPYSKVRDIPLILNGAPLLCNKYMSLNCDIFLRTLSCEEENALLVVHPNTERILSSAIICAAFACIFDGTVIPEEYFEKFLPGDFVIRKGERYRYVGIQDGMCVLASDDTDTATNSVTKIPVRRGLDVRPYSGSSNRTGRQGTIRSHLDANDYLRRIIGEKYLNQVLTIPLCELVVCSRETAQYIADNLMFVHGKYSYRVADAIPFAWVHDVDNYEVLFGSVDKPEPACLFTNRVSLARELLFEDYDYQKRISTVILYDIDNSAPASELYDIKEQVNRRKNGHFITLQSAGKVSERINGIIDERVQTVVWSSDVLLSTIDDLYHEPQSLADRTIMTAINRTIDNTINRLEIPSTSALTDLKDCKIILKQLIRLRSRYSDVDEFILCAYGLINLFEQAAFTMKEYENYITEGLVETRSPGKQIEKLYKLTETFDDIDIVEKAEFIFLLLSEAYSSLYDVNPKREALLRCVAEARDSQKSFFIIVPKFNHVEIVRKVCTCIDNENVSIPTQLPLGEDFERLIMTATPNVKKNGYNPLAERAANETIILEYESEGLKNNCYQRIIDRAFATINRSAKRSASKLFGITLEDEDLAPSQIGNETELDETEQIEIDLSSIEIETVISHVVDKSQSGSTPIHAIRLAQFNTGEWAMFSHYYTVYVLDPSTGELIEKSPFDLYAGDIVIFSAAGSEITDFIENILKQLAKDNHVLEQHFERSRRWKQTLSDYINTNSLTYQNISDRSICQVNVGKDLSILKSAKHWVSNADGQQAFTATSKMLGHAADGEGNSGIYQALASPSHGLF